MDVSQLLRALGIEQAYGAYQRNIGEPFAAVVGGGVRGYLGFDKPDYGGLLAEESYRTGQALGNMPALGAPAGAFKAAAKAPELLGLLGMVAGKTGAAKAISQNTGDLSKFQDVVEYMNPKRIVPPHQVESAEKLNAITQSMKSEGWVGRPILYYDVGQGPEALTGSHRIQAAIKAGVNEIPVVKVSGDIGNYVDEFGTAINELKDLDAKQVSRWLKKYGDETAASLMELEAIRQID